MDYHLPRLVIAGLAGDVGKSLVTLGVIRALRARGRVVAPFKKGPDFIDAAWLGAAAGAPGRNLDTFMMPRESILTSVGKAAGTADAAVIEGNRGLFDGLDAEGSHSTAQLAHLLRTPVALVIDVTKTTRTVAALVMGCRALDPALEIVGVILNRVGTARQEKVIREAVTREAGVRVLGAIPRRRGQELPSRHLGLLTAAEHPQAERVLDELGRTIEEHLDMDAIVELAGRAAPLPVELEDPTEGTPTTRVRIGVLRDQAFSFYYPENLEALRARGAELVSISPLEDRELPEIDALYAGGGFPEVYAERLTSNEVLRAELRARIEDGLPVWAECGGLTYLSRSLRWRGRDYPMVGALPVVVEQGQRPRGHGYVQGRVTGANPFLGRGTEFKGHEFHYSRVVEETPAMDTVLELERGVGLGQGRDGLREQGVVASYTHLHALGTPDWATGLVAAAAGEPRCA